MTLRKYEKFGIAVLSFQIKKKLLEKLAIKPSSIACSNAPLGMSYSVPMDSFE